MWLKISEKKGGWLDKDCRDKGVPYFSHEVMTKKHGKESGFFMGNVLQDSKQRGQTN